ncbi:uncharacterized protein LOC106959346 [Poecilia latipinna]|uniref:uncharacterized protein LOC106959346 n=1 Tax=Poecilia latipinna TaxID=48699 RepID=UPI00072EB577|nr:PREDICTED: uncharacterized protein LOC106959346 [Poecilia latipinna]
MKEEDQEVKVEEDQEDLEDQGLRTEVKAEETEEVNLAENHEHRQDPEPDRQDPEPDRQDPEPDRQDPEPDRQDPEPDRHTVDSTQTQMSASGLQETSGPLRCCPICQSGLWERLKGFHQVKNASQTQLTWSAGHTNIQPHTEPTVDERGKESNRAKTPEGPGLEERRRMQPGCCTELFQAYKSRLGKLEWEKSELEARVGRLERVLMGSKRSAAADGAEDGLQPDKRRRQQAEAEDGASSWTQPAKGTTLTKVGTKTERIASMTTSTGDPSSSQWVSGTGGGRLMGHLRLPESMNESLTQFQAVLVLGLEAKKDAFTRLRGLKAFLCFMSDGYWRLSDWSFLHNVARIRLWIKVMLSRGKKFSTIRSYLRSACWFLEFLLAARPQSCHRISATQTQVAEILQVLKTTSRETNRRNTFHLKPLRREQLSGLDAVATCLRLAPGRVEDLLAEVETDCSATRSLYLLYGFLAAYWSCLSGLRPRVFTALTDADVSKAEKEMTEEGILIRVAERQTSPRSGEAAFALTCREFAWIERLVPIKAQRGGSSKYTLFTTGTKKFSKINRYVKLAWAEMGLRGSINFTLIRTIMADCAQSALTKGSGKRAGTAAPHRLKANRCAASLQDAMTVRKMVICKLAAQQHPQLLSGSSPSITTEPSTSTQRSSTSPSTSTSTQRSTQRSSIARCSCSSRVLQEVSDSSGLLSDPRAGRPDLKSEGASGDASEIRNMAACFVRLSPLKIPGRGCGQPAGQQVTRKQYALRKRTGMKRKYTF